MTSKNNRYGVNMYLVKINYTTFQGNKKTKEYDTATLSDAVRIVLTAQIRGDITSYNIIKETRLF